MTSTAVSFKPLSDQSKRPDTLTAILEFTNAGMQTFSQRRSSLSINTSRSEGYLEIKFVRYDDKREFLKHWPGGVSPSKQREQRPADLLSGVHGSPDVSTL